MNRAFCDGLGYRPDELTGRPISDFCEVDEADPLHRIIDPAPTFETTLQTRQGTPVRASVSRVVDSETPGHRGIVIRLNSTRQRGPTESALHIEQRVDALTRPTREVFYECDFGAGLRGGVLWLSDSFEKIFGYTSHEETLDWWRGRIHPHDLDRIDALGLDVASGRVDGTAAEYRFQRADGSYANVVGRGYVVRNPDGITVRSLGTVTDITEQKAALSEAASTEHRLQALFDNALDLILLLNDQGYFIDANPSATALLGYSREEMVRLHFTALTPPPTEKEAEQQWHDLLREGRSVREFTICRKDGGWVDIEYCAVRDIQPGVHLVIARDMTLRNEFRKTVAQNQLRLEALARRVVQTQEDERGRLARELHDEIGQTLTAVTLGVDAIGRINTDPRVVALLEDMHTAIDEAVERVRELSLGLRPLMLDHLGLASTLRWFLDGQTQKGNLRPHFTLPCGSRRFDRDVETACFRIVQEAVTNVIRHCGAVNVWVELDDNTDHLHLTVKDDGPGFDVLTQQNRPASSLGLLGMAERARLVGGNFKISSRPGEGTTISVHFPHPAEVQP
jgi:PAS domain S-box-containing protein